MCSSLLQEFEAAVDDGVRDYKEKVRSMLSSWSRLSEQFSQHSPDWVHQIVEKLYRASLGLVLQGEWSHLEEDLKTQLENALKRCVGILANHTAARDSCQRLARIMHDAWQNPMLSRVLDGDKLSDPEAEELCGSETLLVLRLRVNMLVESRCDDYALKLVEVCWKCIQNRRARASQEANNDPNTSTQPPTPSHLTEDQNFFLDIYSLLLYKFSRRQELFREVEGLSPEEGLELVKRFYNHTGTKRIWKISLKAAEFISQCLVTTALYSNNVSPILTDVSLVWADINVKLGVPEEELIASIKKMASCAKQSQNVYRFLAALNNKLGNVLKKVYIEQYIRVLTSDTNHLETLKLKGSDKELKYFEAVVAQGFMGLGDVLKDNIGLSRECALTAFSLDPTPERLEELRALSRRGGDSSPIKVKEEPQVKEEVNAAGECTNRVPVAEYCDKQEVVTMFSKVGKVLSLKSLCIDVCRRTLTVVDCGPVCKCKIASLCRTPELEAHKRAIRKFFDEHGEVCEADAHLNPPLPHVFNACVDKLCEQLQEAKEKALSKAKRTVDVGALVKIMGNQLTSSVHYDVVSAPSRILDAEKLGLSREMCDDLAVLLSGSRCHLLTWAMSWNDLEKQCIKYLKNPNERRSFQKELKFVEPEEKYYKDSSSDAEIDYYDCYIEKGYEAYVEKEYSTPPKPRLEVYPRARRSPGSSESDTEILLGKRKTAIRKRCKKQNSSDSDSSLNAEDYDTTDPDTDDSDEEAEAAKTPSRPDRPASTPAEPTTKLLRMVRKPAQKEELFRKKSKLKLQSPSTSSQQTTPFTYLSTLTSSQSNTKVTNPPKIDMAAMTAKLNKQVKRREERFAPYQVKQEHGVKVKAEDSKSSLPSASSAFPNVIHKQFGDHMYGQTYSTASKFGSNRNIIRPTNANAVDSIMSKLGLTSRADSVAAQKKDIHLKPVTSILQDTLSNRTAVSRPLPTFGDTTSQDLSTKSVQQGGNNVSKLLTQWPTHKTSPRPSSILDTKTAVNLQINRQLAKPLVPLSSATSNFTGVVRMPLQKDNLASQLKAQLNTRLQNANKDVRMATATPSSSASSPRIYQHQSSDPGTPTKLPSFQTFLNPITSFTGVVTTTTPSNVLAPVSHVLTPVSHVLSSRVSIAGTPVISTAPLKLNESSGTTVTPVIQKHTIVRPIITPVTATTTASTQRILQTYQATDFSKLIKHTLSTHGEIGTDQTSSAPLSFALDNSSRAQSRIAMSPPVVSRPPSRQFPSSPGTSRVTGPQFPSSPGGSSRSAQFPSSPSPLSPASRTSMQSPMSPTSVSRPSSQFSSSPMSPSVNRPHSRSSTSPFSSSQPGSPVISQGGSDTLKRLLSGEKTIYSPVIEKKALESSPQKVFVYRAAADCPKIQQVSAPFAEGLGAKLQGIPGIAKPKETLSVVSNVPTDSPTSPKTKGLAVSPSASSNSSSNKESESLSDMLREFDEVVVKVKTNHDLREKAAEKARLPTPTIVQQAVVKDSEGNVVPRVIHLVQPEDSSTPVRHTLQIAAPGTLTPGQRAQVVSITGNLAASSLQRKQPPPPNVTITSGGIVGPVVTLAQPSVLQKVITSQDSVLVTIASPLQTTVSSNVSQTIVTTTPSSQDGQPKSPAKKGSPKGGKSIPTTTTTTISSPQASATSPTPGRQTPRPPPPSKQNQDDPETVQRVNAILEEYTKEIKKLPPEEQMKPAQRRNVNVGSSKSKKKKSGSGTLQSMSSSMEPLSPSSLDLNSDKINSPSKMGLDDNMQVGSSPDSTSRHDLSSSSPDMPRVSNSPEIRSGQGIVTTAVPGNMRLILNSPQGGVSQPGKSTFVVLQQVPLATPAVSSAEDSPLRVKTTNTVTTKLAQYVPTTSGVQLVVQGGGVVGQQSPFLIKRASGPGYIQIPATPVVQSMQRPTVTKSVTVLDPSTGTTSNVSVGDFVAGRGAVTENSFKEKKTPDVAVSNSSSVEQLISLASSSIGDLLPNLPDKRQGTIDEKVDSSVEHAEADSTTPTTSNSLLSALLEKTSAPMVHAPFVNTSSDLMNKLASTIESAQNTQGVLSLNPNVVVTAVATVPATTVPAQRTNARVLPLARILESKNLPTGKFLISRESLPILLSRSQKNALPASAINAAPLKMTPKVQTATIPRTAVTLVGAAPRSSTSSNNSSNVVNGHGSTPSVMLPGCHSGFTITESSGTLPSFGSLKYDTETSEAAVSLLNLKANSVSSNSETQLSLENGMRLMGGNGMDDSVEQLAADLNIRIENPTTTASSDIPPRQTEFDFTLEKSTNSSTQAPLFLSTNKATKCVGRTATSVIMQEGPAKLNDFDILKSRIRPDILPSDLKDINVNPQEFISGSSDDDNTSSPQKKAATVPVTPTPAAKKNKKSGGSTKNDSSGKKPSRALTEKEKFVMSERAKQQKRDPGGRFLKNLSDTSGVATTVTSAYKVPQPVPSQLSAILSKSSEALPKSELSPLDSATRQMHATFPREEATSDPILGKKSRTSLTGRICDSPVKKKSKALDLSRPSEMKVVVRGPQDDASQRTRRTKLRASDAKKPRMDDHMKKA